MGVTKVVIAVLSGRHGSGVGSSEASPHNSTSSYRYEIRS